MHRCLTLGENSLAAARTETQSISQDAYHRVQFKLLMDLLIQYGAKGCRSAPGKNRGYAAWKVELCSSSAHNGPTARITALAGPLQCLTKGLADLNLNGPCKILTLADDGLIYKTSKDSQEAAETLQQELDSVSK